MNGAERLERSDTLEGRGGISRAWVWWAGEGTGKKSRRLPPSGSGDWEAPCIEIRDNDKGLGTETGEKMWVSPGPAGSEVTAVYPKELLEESVDMRV